MGRDLKFRAWDEPTDVNGPTGMSYDARPDCDATAIMQFTGHCDRNGKEIYEGDILRDDDGLAVCAWCNNMSGWGYCLVESDGSYNGAEGTMAEWATECEVVGNIYEHSHLLEPQ